MPFDPTKPADNSPLVSAEMREQFNELKQLIDAQEARIAALEAALAGTARNPPLGELSVSLNDPPTAGQVQSIVDFLNALNTNLYRSTT